MKKTFSLLFLLASLNTYSATVKITSFASVRIANIMDHPIAELCGKVDNLETTPTFIRVKVDEGSRKPATYNTIADDKGHFCLTISTYRGRAEVSIIGDPQTAIATLSK